MKKKSWKEERCKSVISLSLLAGVNLLLQSRDHPIINGRKNENLSLRAKIHLDLGEPEELVKIELLLLLLLVIMYPLNHGDLHAVNNLNLIS